MSVSRAFFSAFTDVLLSAFLVCFLDFHSKSSTRRQNLEKVMVVSFLNIIIDFNIQKIMKYVKHRSCNNEFT